MSKDMIKGEKAQLEALMPGTVLEVGLNCQLATEAVDLSCFGVDSDGKLSDDRYFIFYNQRQSPEKAIEAKGGGDGYGERFAINLNKLPPSIVRLVFVATIDGQATFSSLSAGKLDLIGPNGLAASYHFSGADFAEEKAIIIGEIYLKTIWRMAAVGQGFNGGLSALLKQFGGEEISPPPVTESRVEKLPVAEPKVPEPKVKLSKVRLDKQGQSHQVNLSKGGSPTIFHINLQWDQPNANQPEKQSGSFLGRILKGAGQNSGADLDLGCMWRDISGNKGVIQPLGGNFGSKDNIPYIFLDKDDRSGAAVDGENMHLFRPDQLDLVVIFAMIYEGAANFANVNARLTISDGRGDEILIPLNAPNPSHTFCAVATISRTGSSIKFRKEEQYFPGHKLCDKQYGFGFDWVKGRK